MIFVRICFNSVQKDFIWLLTKIFLTLFALDINLKTMFFTIIFLKKRILFYLQKDVWPDYGKNEESVAELWLGLLSFYTCDFSWKDYVISIRQKKPLTRFKKLWNTNQLAIEGMLYLFYLDSSVQKYILKY